MPGRCVPSGTAWPAAFGIPSPSTQAYSVVVVRPSRAAISAATALRSAMAAIAIIRAARPISCGRPRARPRRRQPSIGALGGRPALEGGKRQAPVGRRRVDLRAGAGQRLQADAPRTQVLDRVDQVAQVTAEPVRLPKHERVAGLDRLEARG